LASRPNPTVSLEEKKAKSSNDLPRDQETFICKNGQSKKDPTSLALKVNETKKLYIHNSFSEQLEQSNENEKLRQACHPNYPYSSIVPTNNYNVMPSFLTCPPTITSEYIFQNNIDFAYILPQFNSNEALQQMQNLNLSIPQTTQSAYYPKYSYGNPSMNSSLNFAQNYYSYNTGVRCKTISNDEFVERTIKTYEDSNFDHSLLVGKIAALSHFQSGSRYLQIQLAKGDPEFSGFIIDEVICSYLL
jgi:hypothetical protein